MNTSTQRKLDALQADYTAEVSRPFEHFFCPVLYRDEDVELCQAHIVNRAFRGSTKRWTIQRTDVDHFYGSIFESTFVQLRHKGKRRLDEFLTDKDLARHFSPTFTIGGKPVPHYFPTDKVPPSFSEVTLSTGTTERRLGLKIAPEMLLAADVSTMTFSIESDLRLSAMSSLLKAAHLTLFDLLGYRYAFSPGGHFLGKTILGDFFLANRGLRREEIMRNALFHFRQYANMVRPISQLPEGLRGTASDQKIYVCCTGEKTYWAILVFVRTGNMMHAVLTPVFDHPDGVVRFLSLLDSPTQHFEAHFAIYERGQWRLDKNLRPFYWPPVEPP